MRHTFDSNDFNEELVNYAEVEYINAKSPLSESDVMDDLNNITPNKINVIIYTNGEVQTYTEAGITIVELCGNLPILHKLLPFIKGRYRRDWFTKKYGTARTPDISFKICHVDKDGDKSYTKDVIYEQLIELAKYIKKK